MSMTPNYGGMIQQSQAMQMQQAQSMYEAQRRAAEQMQRARIDQEIGWGALGQNVIIKDTGSAQKRQGLSGLYTDSSNNLNVNTTMRVDGDLEVTGKIITKETKMLGIYGSLKAYIQKHADLIFTVALVMLADKWFFKGAFTNTLQSLVGKLVNRAHDEVDSKPLTVAK